jgi:drug/metabolite transporter (DMT)-like permease
VGYLLVVLSAFSYAGGIVAQTIAARRTAGENRLDVGLVARLAGDRLYLLGFSAQVLGFVLAFLARADLPLYLVQAGTTSAVGLAAVVGAVLFGWRIGRAESAALVVLAVGLVLLVGAARPSVSEALPLWAGLILLGVLVAVAALAAVAARVPGPRGAVALGVLAGCAFAVLAIASRPLAAGPLLELPTKPLAWLMVAAAVVGQFLLASALQRGSPTATMASMDATGVLLASAAGLLVLGDQVVPGRGPLVGIGLGLVVAGVVAMAFVARTSVAHGGAADRVQERMGTP